MGWSFAVTTVWPRRWALALPVCALAALAACAAAKPKTTPTSSAASHSAGQPRVSGPAQPTGGAEPHPAWARDCVTAEDCEISWSYLDCCGTGAATGVRKGAARPAVAPARISCECLAQPTRLDDGQTAEDPAQIELACDARTCTTRRAVSQSVRHPFTSAEPR
jgi:hypothetical protein